MIAPLTEASDERAYRITKYRIDEHKIHKINENAWLVEYINGYYAYEGIDVVPMEAVLEYETADEDGLVSFMRQGSSGGFMYVLLRDGDVYRLRHIGDIVYDGE